MSPEDVTILYGNGEFRASSNTHYYSSVWQSGGGFCVFVRLKDVAKETSLPEWENLGFRRTTKTSINLYKQHAKKLKKENIDGA